MQLAHRYGGFMKQIFFALTLLLPSSAFADYSTDALVSGFVNGAAQGLAGQQQPAFNNNFQQQQNLQLQLLQQESLRQQIEQQKLQNQILRQQANQPINDLLNDNTAQGATQNCTTIGNGNLYNTSCR